MWNHCCWFFSFECSWHTRTIWHLGSQHQVIRRLGHCLTAAICNWSILLSASSSSARKTTSIHCVSPDLYWLQGSIREALEILFYNLGANGSLKSLYRRLRLSKRTVCIAWWSRETVSEGSLLASGGRMVLISARIGSQEEDCLSTPSRWWNKKVTTGSFMRFFYSHVQICIRPDALHSWEAFTGPCGRAKESIDRMSCKSCYYYIHRTWRIHNSK